MVHGTTADAIISQAEKMSDSIGFGQTSGYVLRTPGEVLRWLAWGTLIAGPVLLLAMFRLGAIPDPSLAGPAFHFYIVTGTSLVVFILAFLMHYAAGQLKDPRALFLSLAFFSIAGVFLVHALTTPGVLVDLNPWVGFSARLSTFVGATFLCVSTAAWAPERRTFIVRYQSWITLATGLLLASYGGVALLTSSLDWYPISLSALLTADPVVYTITSLTFAMLGYVILRYARIYRSSSSPIVLGILLSSILLAQGKLSMVVAPLWNASWWEYHVLLLAGFGVALVSLGWEYYSSRSIESVVGGLMLRDSVTQVKRGYTDVIVALIEAVEAKDHYTRGHTQRVAELSVLVADQLGLPAAQRQILNQAAVLHDIGKIGIPDAVLNKEGPLTGAEFELIKEHPIRGYRMIQHVRSLQAESEGVRYHHERLDGSGYPDGLVGDEIPMIARIIAVADVFDALTSSRPYRSAFTVEQAIDILKNESGTKLDPDCVAGFLRVLPVWEHRMSTSQSSQEPRLGQAGAQFGSQATSN